MLLTAYVWKRFDCFVSCFFGNAQIYMSYIFGRCFGTILMTFWPFEDVFSAIGCNYLKNILAYQRSSIMWQAIINERFYSATFTIYTIHAFPLLTKSDKDKKKWKLDVWSIKNSIAMILCFMPMRPKRKQVENWRDWLSKPLLLLLFAYCYGFDVFSNGKNYKMKKQNDHVLLD